MKKIFSLLFVFLIVGVVFVGCSKEGKTYFYDVYDYWQEKVEEGDDKVFYDKNSTISFAGDNINDMVETDFTEIERYQEIFNNIKSDIDLLSREFIHDPKLEGKALKNAQKKVTSYKEQLGEYASEISRFKSAKKSFEATCENLDFDVAGIIEKDEYSSFLNKFRSLINSVNNVFSKMFDCANSMFYSGEVAGFASNEERIKAVKENYFEAKVLLTADYIYFCYDNDSVDQPPKDKETIRDNYNLVRNLQLSDSSLNKEQSDANLSKIDSLIEQMSLWIDYFKSQSSFVKTAISEGNFKYDISNLEANTLENALIKENYEKYFNLINSTMKNLSETCASLVAFY